MTGGIPNGIGGIPDHSPRTGTGTGEFGYWRNRALDAETERDRLASELQRVQRWFASRPWAEAPDPRDFGGRPYSDAERALGYGTYRDPRFLPTSLVVAAPDA